MYIRLIDKLLVKDRGQLEKSMFYFSQLQIEIAICEVTRTELKAVAFEELSISGVSEMSFFSQIVWGTSFSKIDGKYHLNKNAS